MNPPSSAQTITLDLPEALYEHVRHTATVLKRRLEDVLLEAVATALPPVDALPRDVADDLATLPFSNDAALFQVARSTVAPEIHAETTVLLERKSSGEISRTEQERLDELVRAHEGLTLKRAQAAVLLQRRGYDMSDPAVLNRLP